MSITTLITIFDPSASPQTGVGDADSGIILVGPVDTNRGGAAELYDIFFSADYAGGAGTLTPYICNDPSESPRRWVAYTIVDSDGTIATVTRAGDFTAVLPLPTGCLVKWTLSGSGSPIPNISMTARGVCRGNA